MHVMIAAPGSALLATTLLHGEGFSWTRWAIHPSVLIGCLLLAGGYLAARRFAGEPGGPDGERVGRDAGRVGADGDGVEGWRTAAFLGGVAVMFVALNGPIHDLSDGYLFSAHMVQHMLLMMIMPPLLLLGLSARMVRPLLRRPGVMRSARFLTHPAVAFVIYNVVFIGWHFPGAYNLALENHDVHIVQHLMFMAAAVIMWWPVVNPVPELARIGRPLQLLYLFAFGIPMSVVSAMITLSGSVLYPFYAEAPRVLGLSVLSDQQLGGLIMWVPGMFIYWTAVTIVFFQWYGGEDGGAGDVPAARDAAAARRAEELARATTR